jgi:hypothetical protein
MTTALGALNFRRNKNQGLVCRLAAKCRVRGNVLRFIEQTDFGRRYL